MEINYYIKQISIFREKLDEWDVYLKELYKNALSPEKSSIRIRELNDRKDLIKCEGLEGNQLHDELRKIYKVIDEEQIIYKKLYNLILNPKEYSLFSFKSTTKTKRDNEIKLLFKQLFDINEEQKVRVDSFSKSLKLLALEEGKVYKDKEKNRLKTVVVEKSDISQDALSKTETTSISEIKDKSDDHTKTPSETSNLKEEVKRKVNPEVKETAIDSVEKSEFTQKDSSGDADDEFDYESEVKRLLGL
jgi:hypothetical protein